MSKLKVENNKLTIRFEPSADYSAQPLSEQVQQIISQRGSFRDVSEKSLHEEIESSSRAHDASRLEESDLHADSGDDETTQTRNERLWKTREEMIKKINYAQNELLSALDFVSLLLSSNNPAAAGSMSPALKELVPPKTLASRVIGHEPLAQTAVDQRRHVAEGWKAESFKVASNKIASASSRLAHQTENQNKYWEQIAELQSQGWAVSRLPTNGRAFGVHIGSQESAPQFRSKGFAMLEQTGTGDLELRVHSSTRTRPSLKVSIIRKSVETGASEFDGRGSEDLRHMPAIHIDLMSARDKLFEEELFYELSREARLIANQGVRSSMDSIEADIYGDYQVRISYDESRLKVRQPVKQVDDELACLTASCLRLLLITEHGRLHERRCQPPPPVISGPVTIPEYAVLRPVLALLRHQSNISKMVRAVKSFIHSFRSAGIELNVNSFDSAAISKSVIHANNFKSLRLKTESSVVVQVGGSIPKTIKFETYLGPPLYGTAYETSKVSYDFVEQKAETWTTFEEAYNSARNYLVLALTAHVQAHVNKGVNGMQDNVKVNISKPHSGELIVSRSDRGIAKMLVGVAASQITLQCVQIKNSTTQKSVEKVYLWSASGLKEISKTGSREISKMTLNEILNELTMSFDS